MPIYDYTCSACGHLTEVIHGINDHGPRFCPECGAEGTMKKGFTTPAIHFKGSGWAKKDRSSASRQSTAKKEESTTKKDESKTTASGDTGTSGGAPSGDSPSPSSGDSKASSSGDSTGSSSGSTAAAAD